MGYVAVGSFSEGWRLIFGEPLASDLADMDPVDGPPAQYLRGTRTPRYLPGDLPSEQAEVES